jgi:hypothetical protein
MTVRGGGVPGQVHGFKCRPSEWVRRLGALAADAHHCIMVWVFGPPNRRMWRELFVHHMRAPLGRRHPDHNKYAVVLGAIKAKPVGGRPMGGQP